MLLQLYNYETKYINLAVRRTLPYAFTEEGIAMLSELLKNMHCILNIRRKNMPG
ncbi:MAG: hypothetical protein RSB76_00005 [Clostridia bacterium]